jgi:hypothetical protein
MITIAMCITNVRLKVFFVDCKSGTFLIKKEIVSPNSSSFKTYFSDPYFCILYGRAKLLLLDIRQVIASTSDDFQEISTMLNLK